MTDHDKTALAEITEHNRVLAENVEFRKENQDLKAHCLNLMGKLEVIENVIPQPLLDLASTHAIELVRTEERSTVRRFITHHMGS